MDTGPTSYHNHLRSSHERSSSPSIIFNTSDPYKCGWQHLWSQPPIFALLLLLSSRRRIPNKRLTGTAPVDVEISPSLRLSLPLGLDGG